MVWSLSWPKIGIWDALSTDYPVSLPPLLFFGSLRIQRILIRYPSKGCWLKSPSRQPKAGWTQTRSEDKLASTNKGSRDEKGLWVLECLLANMQSWYGDIAMMFESTLATSLPKNLRIYQVPSVLYKLQWHDVPQSNSLHLRSIPSPEALETEVYRLKLWLKSHKEKWLRTRSRVLYAISFRYIINTCKGQDVRRKCWQGFGEEKFEMGKILKTIGMELICMISVTSSEKTY